MSRCRPVTDLRLGAPAAAVALLLAGCQLSPEPVTSLAAAPVAWREAGAAAAWPAKDEWAAFGSPELVSLIAQAEAGDDDLAAAEARVREADAQARIAGAALLPTLDLEPTVGPTRRLNPVGRERHYTTAEATFNASYEFDVWGKNRAARANAVSAAEAARYDRAVVDLTTVAGVASTYIQLLSLREEIAGAEANLASARQVLADAEALQRGGLGTSVQVVQQELQVDTLITQLPPLRQQAVHALDALAVLVGGSPETIRVKAANLAGLTPPTLTAGAPSHLMAHRPDVQAAERRLSAARANITVARAAFLPSFNLNAQGGIAALALSHGTAGPLGVYNLALDAVAPIFDGGRLKGQLELSRAQEVELVADYAKTARQAYADVEDALAAVKASDEQEQAAQRASDQAQRALVLTRAGYRGGSADILSVLASETAAFPARTALSQAKAARLQSVVGLYRALGGGWTDPWSLSPKFSTPIGSTSTVSTSTS